jgi:hypothetical protein
MALIKEEIQLRSLACGGGLCPTLVCRFPMGSTPSVFVISYLCHKYLCKTLNFSPSYIYIYIYIYIYSSAPADLLKKKADQKCIFHYYYLAVRSDTHFYLQPPNPVGEQLVAVCRLCQPRHARLVAVVAKLKPANSSSRCKIPTNRERMSLISLIALLQQVANQHHFASVVGWNVPCVRACVATQARLCGFVFILSRFIL